MLIAHERRTGAEIHVNIARPRAIGIFGKRGSGKTTTLTRIAQAAADLGHLVVIVDPLSAIRPAGHIRVFLGEPDPGNRRLWLNPPDLSPDAWLQLFDLKPSDPMGIALFRAVLTLTETGGWWSVNDLANTLATDELAADKTIQALQNRLHLARLWGIFAEEETDTVATFEAGTVNILDLGRWEPGPTGLRNLAVRLLADRLFAYRLDAWRSGSAAPPVLLAVDEAHNFAPANLAALARPALVRWAKEGRQPHANLLVATQQPSALTFDLVSQCDLTIIHHLSLADDIKTTQRLAALYAADLAAWLKGITRPGEAIIMDDIAERAYVGHVVFEEVRENDTRRATIRHPIPA